VTARLRLSAVAACYEHLYLKHLRLARPVSVRARTTTLPPSRSRPLSGHARIVAIILHHV